MSATVQTIRPRAILLNLECDVAAPERLGLYTIWIDTARAGLPAGAGVQPHRIIHSLTALR